MKNIYDGTVTTDASGYATVTLPEWFEALNKDFRYQLTVIGDFAQAIIFKKIQNNQFTIRTDKPNVEVSWQVTGIRHDAFAEKNRIPVEEYKKGEDVGKYRRHYQKKKPSGEFFPVAHEPPPFLSLPSSKWQTASFVPATTNGTLYSNTGRRSLTSAGLATR